jgi:hypothetical protein
MGPPDRFGDHFVGDVVGQCVISAMMAKMTPLP